MLAKSMLDNSKRNYKINFKRFLLLLMSAVFLTCSQTGTQQARQDINEGVPKYLIYGELMLSEDELAKRLHEEYMIELTREEDCTVDNGYIAFVKSYNDEIQKHFGLDIETILNKYLSDISILSDKNIGKLDTLKCNTKVLLKVFQNKKSLDIKTIQDFLMAFGSKCKNNAEFIEWSNELLFDILKLYPAQIVDLLDKNQEIESDVILDELRNPIHDLVDIPLIINAIENNKSDSELKKKLITALKSISQN